MALTFCHTSLRWIGEYTSGLFGPNILYVVPWCWSCVRYGFTRFLLAPFPHQSHEGVQFMPWEQKHEKDECHQWQWQWQPVLAWGDSIAFFAFINSSSERIHPVRVRHVHGVLRSRHRLSVAPFNPSNGMSNGDGGKRGGGVYEHPERPKGIPGLNNQTYWSAAIMDSTHSSLSGIQSEEPQEGRL